MYYIYICHKTLEAMIYEESTSEESTGLRLVHVLPTFLLCNQIPVVIYEITLFKFLSYLASRG